MKSQFFLFNTDFLADQTNYEGLVFKAAGTKMSIASVAAGTGTLRPVEFLMNTANALTIATSGGVSVGSNSDPGTGNLTVTGTVTANTFVGDGSGLTGKASVIACTWTSPTYSAEFTFSSGGGVCTTTSTCKQVDKIVYYMLNVSCPTGSSVASTVNGSISLPSTAATGIYPAPGIVAPSGTTTGINGNATGAYLYTEAFTATRVLRYAGFYFVD